MAKLTDEDYARMDAAYVRGFVKQTIGYGGDAKQARANLGLNRVRLENVSKVMESVRSTGKK